MRSPLPWLLAPFVLFFLLLALLGRRERADEVQNPVPPEVRPLQPAERVQGPEAPGIGARAAEGAEVRPPGGNR